MPPNPWDRWVELAEMDRDTTAILLNNGGSPEVISFHAQQCAEKYLKALLVKLGCPFQRTHDLKALLQSLPGGYIVSQPVEFAALSVSPFAVEIRYPGLPTLSESDARSCMAHMETIVAWVTAELQVP